MISSLFGILLLLDKLGIGSIREVSEKGIVIADFGQFSLLENYDGVSVSYSRESVSNHYCCNCSKFTSNRVNRCLHFSFILLVKSRCGFIKDQNFWLFYESSCYCDSLFLTS